MNLQHQKLMHVYRTCKATLVAFISRCSSPLLCGCHPTSGRNSSTSTHRRLNLERMGELGYHVDLLVREKENGWRRVMDTEIRAEETGLPSLVLMLPARMLQEA